jgi:hypothetical protein
MSVLAGERSEQSDFHFSLAKVQGLPLPKEV